MRLSNVHTLKLGEFSALPAAQRPPYAILSHRWGSFEITYKDWLNGRNLSGSRFLKIMDFCRLVRAMSHQSSGFPDLDGYLNSCQLQWVWIDTCCINKTSSAELFEAVNSMYVWLPERCHLLCASGAVLV